MSAVVFLLLVVAIVAVGSVVLYLRQRPSSSMESGIDNFKREMEALAVHDDDRPRPHRWKR